MRGAIIRTHRSRAKYLYLFILLAIVVAMGLYYYWPQLNPQTKLDPGQPTKNDPGPPGAQYDYYTVIDAETTKVLMYVSSVRVSVGDELITDDGKWYTVVEVNKNVAHAKFNPEKTKQQ